MQQSFQDAAEETWYLEPMTEVAAELNTHADWTWGHSSRVARYAVAFGRKLGLGAQEMMALQCAALLHDVGKMVVPPDLLDKASTLSRDEWYSITKHAMASAQIIKGSSLAVQIAGIARAHHEWFDGKGYPLGLNGDGIPFGARILSLADACDAMSSDRPYRAALQPDQIISEIEKGAGTQFDPVLVRKLRAVLKLDLNDMFPKRVARVVSKDAGLVQQLWFALYPNGWDIERYGQLPSGAEGKQTESLHAEAKQQFILTIIDGRTIHASPADIEIEGPALWIDPPEAGQVDLARPLDLAGVLGAVARVEGAASRENSIRVLLGDPYQLFRQALKQCLDDEDDIKVVGDVDSAVEFRALRERLPHDIAIVASDMLVGTFTTGTLRPDDILLAEHETMPAEPGQPPVIVLVSDDDLEDPRIASRVWRPGATLTANAFIYRGSPAEVLVEAIRSLTL